MSAVPSIRKLDETVVNRIAAGEVIQRPANALKELLENSLDAKASKIQIIAKHGGLKFLQIQDNGIGIRKEDLGIVCERFTTSKLTTFEDLTRISTYGFRGEALASISHVAHLTIVTKTADSQVGYKVSYEDSQVQGPAKACAATQGTQITVEDLFYNISTRRKALKNPNEEHGKIINVVSKYAVHNPKVGFSLKKQGESISDIKTSPDSTVVDNIRIIYGNSIANELLEIKNEDETLKFQLNAQITNVNYSSKKLIFLLFINNRLVDSTGLRKIIEQAYSTYLPKNSHPFVYLSIQLDPQNVDVNVHPTKHEVHFLHEEAIIDKVRLAIENRLVGSNSSRVLFTQAKLPTTFTIDVEAVVEQNNCDKKVSAHKVVRTDSNDQKLDKFFKPSISETEIENLANSEASATAKNKECDKVTEKRDIKLRSVLQLRADVENSLHNGLQNIVNGFIFVGFISPSQCLMQYDTKLYLCNTEKLVQELFYQMLLFEFANLGVIRFVTPVSVKELILFYLDCEDCGWSETDGPKEELATSMTLLLVEKCAMLEDYFSIEIDTNGDLCSLPLVIDKYTPDIALLPDFMFRLCTEVDWNLEKPCLDGICKEVSKFYSKIATATVNDSDNKQDSNWKWTVEHVLLPAVKTSLLPPAKFSQDGTILQIANLPDLYKVFERC